MLVELTRAEAVADGHRRGLRRAGLQLAANQRDRGLRRRLQGRLIHSHRDPAGATEPVEQEVGRLRSWRLAKVRWGAPWANGSEFFAGFPTPSSPRVVGGSHATRTRRPGCREELPFTAQRLGVYGPASKGLRYLPRNFVAVRFLNSIGSLDASPVRAKSSDDFGKKLEGSMAKDIPEEISIAEREFSRRRFLRNAGAAGINSAARRRRRDPGFGRRRCADLQAQRRPPVLRGTQEVPLRDGQPRNHELVLHCHDLRLPGLLCPYRLHLHLDRFGELGRVPDGLGHGQRDRLRSAMASACRSSTMWPSTPRRTRHSMLASL